MNDSFSSPFYSANPARSPVSGKNILCLAIDRFNADFLGAYGNGWTETNAFDATAAESIVFDSFFATSLDLETLCRAFWRGENPAKISADADVSNADSDEKPSLFRILKEKGYRTFVVSDVESIALHPAIDDDFCDGRFYLDASDAELPAETLEETRFFRNFEELARFLAKLNDDAKTLGNDAPPWFVWAHFSGWNDRWDFPLDRRERFREDEDDPEAYSATFVPFWPRDDAPSKKTSVVVSTPLDDAAPLDFDSSNDDPDAKNSNENSNDDENDDEIPDGEVARQFSALEFARLSRLDAPERRQSVVEAYCGGVSVFDETFEGFVQLLKESGILEKTLFLTLGTRGFSTDFPGAIGVEPAPESAAAQVFASSTPARAPFYSEEIRLPLAIRLPNGVGATLRLPALCEPRDVFATLRDWPEFSDELSTPEFWRFETTEISPFAGRWSADQPAQSAQSVDRLLDVRSNGVDARSDAAVSPPTSTSKPTTPTENASDDSSDANAPDVPGQNLLRLLANEEGTPRDRILVVARDADSLERALVVDDWLLKATTTTKTENVFPENSSELDVSPATRLELFVRPDDLFNVNDVANRCVDVVEQLEKELYYRSFRKRQEKRV